jgi:ketosteroid isomerase-like protein
MRRWLLTATLFAWAMASAGRADEPDPEKQVAALSERHRVAAVKGDTQALDAVLADDWVVVGPSGEVDTKRQQAQKIKDGSLVFEAIDAQEVKVRMHGDTAIVMGLYHIKATLNGRKVDGVFRNTEVFAKQAGAWRCVFNQVTPVAGQPAEKR